MNEKVSSGKFSSVSEVVRTALRLLENEGNWYEALIKELEVGEKSGFAIESVRRVIDYLFKELNKHRIIASIDPGNANSIQLVERLGFRKEAHLVENDFVNERWIDG